MGNVKRFYYLANGKWKIVSTTHSHYTFHTERDFYTEYLTNEKIISVDWIENEMERKIYE